MPTPALPMIERFMMKVAPEAGGHRDCCLIWTGATNDDDYGVFNGELAHRWIYAHAVAPIDDGLQLDHLCRVHQCVRPSHLEPVTNRENTLRGVRPSQLSLAHRPDQARCKSGRHVWVVGQSRCKSCANENRRERRRQARE